MDDTPSRLQRALVWLEATPVEAAGLGVLLAGAALATGLLVWQAFQRPEPPAGPSVAAPDAPGPADVGHDPENGGVAAGDGERDHHGGDEGGTSGPVVVHVTGAVARPGVVTLDAGDRVADAIAAAGGATHDAQVERLNLARPLQDGEHVHLPREGEEVAPEGADGGTAAGTDAGGLLDLNAATVEQLQTLPGIGPAKAAEIVRHREEHGRFAVPGDLRDVPGIGEATFQRLAELVTVS